MREELIKKWLTDELTPKELEMFKQLDEYSSLIKLSEKAKHFKSPDFDQQESFNEIKLKSASRATNSKPNYIKYIAGVAAVLLIGFLLFKNFNSSNVTTYKTIAADSKAINLPDQSNVSLNAKSQLSFISENWNDNRNLQLDGEAYFKVQKGSKFKVNTEYGDVEVLGTIFNVKARDYAFEVTCYEGSVAVKLKGKSFVLEANDKLRLSEQNVEISEANALRPDWKSEKTVFISKSLDVVLKEFENYYDVEFHISEANSDRLYTGSFTHNDMEIALNSISLPLGLTYEIDGKKIFLSKK